MTTAFDIACDLLYQQRRDEAHFSHITTTQRAMWRYYCLLKQEERERVVKLALNNGIIQGIQKRMSEIMTEIHQVKSSEEAQVLLREAENLEKIAEAINA